MAVTGSLQLSHGLGLFKSQGYDKQLKFLRRESWSVHTSKNLHKSIDFVPLRSNMFRCHAFMLPGQGSELPALKAAASVALSRSYDVLKSSPLFIKLVPAICLITFTAWGLGPLMRQSRNLLLHKNDNSWKKSGTYYFMTSYLQPLLLWVGATLICRALDPVVLPTEASQAVKQRLLNFVRSLSTVLALAYCLSSAIQQAQKFFMESNESSDPRNMGFQFAGKAIYSAVWVAAVSLFMELLGFSTQKWLTAGGLGTVLLTLAGREIFTNFLSSVMIHATRPFVVNEWIQTKIEGYEVSGTVEHVGWWSPTIIRGEDREAVHIPNHKFTVNVVRNLSQKTHWRIKTHLAISHLDVSKINNIVADMRKVLAKNPQVEQQRLHRRVFLDDVNLENQGLLILVSCFVKTSHFEEYLCVKEAILLDLLRVISHHRARLATPIRTMQKIYTDSDLENIPYHDSFYNRGVAANRPLLLIEPSYKIKGDDKSKSQTRSGRVGGESDGKTTSRSMADTKVGHGKSESKTKEFPKSETKAESKIGETPIPHDKDQTEVAAASKSDLKAGDKVTARPAAASVPKTNSSAAEKFVSETKDASSDSDELTQNRKDSNGKQAQGASPGHGMDNGKFDKSSVSSTLEENIVLGVALDGSKRTLPIEDGMASHSSPAESKEVSAAVRNGNKSPNAEKDKKSQKSGSSSATSGDQ